MKSINVKDHTKKYMDVSRKAAKGTYPSIRVAKIGSNLGIGIGVALMGVGIYIISIGNTYGVGSILAGAVTIVSNIINLKRIEKQSKKG
ncbi:hypothetical protein ACI2JA_10960 [Alkalihalobacillus sp. NPDC078783]